MSNSFYKIFNKVKKIEKENLQKDNTKYKEKIVNFAVKNSGEINSEFKFESIDNIVELIIRFDSNSVNKFIFELNDVVISIGEKEAINISKFLYVKKDNTLKFNIENTQNDDINLNIIIKGNIKSKKNNLSKLHFLSNNYYFVKNGILSESNNILSINYNINAYNYNTQDKNIMYIDNNYTFKNIENYKNKIFNIYYKEKLFLKDILLNAEYDTGINSENACLISSNIESKFLNVIYIKDGSVFVKSFSENMTVFADKKITYFDNKNIVNVASVVSNYYVDYFIIKDSSNMWYFVFFDFSKADVVNVVPFLVSDDLMVYIKDNGQVVCIQLMDSGVKIQIFNDKKLDNILYEKIFLNAVDSYYCDNLLYLVGSDNVQEVEL